jgi:transcription elongation factor Elf1
MMMAVQMTCKSCQGTFEYLGVDQSGRIIEECECGNTIAITVTVLSEPVDLDTIIIDEDTKPKGGKEYDF